jgi:hypothetical protein
MNHLLLHDKNGVVDDFHTKLTASARDLALIDPLVRVARLLKT